MLKDIASHLIVCSAACLAFQLACFPKFVQVAIQKSTAVPLPISLFIQARIELT